MLKIIRNSKLIEGGAKLSAGQVATQAFTFLRSVILGRLISPANFGIAATFAMTYAFLEMISNHAANILLIQSPDGDDPVFGKTAHSWQVGRGLLNALVLIAIAGPASELFGDPQAKWAFRFLALVPLLNGFTHFDKDRVQRRLRFGPTIKVDISANALATTAALPLAFWLRDYSAMLWVLILQATFTMAASHWVAERRYGWAWDSRFSRNILSFGWPLIINGILLYLIFQGDRFAIGTAGKLFGHSPYTLADLGVYSIAFSLTMVPANMCVKVTSALFLPRLSEVQRNREQFERRQLVCSQALAVLAALISVPFIASGGWLVTTIYGQKYAAAGEFIAWLGAMWGLRVIRGGVTTVAMALGDTQNAMVSNIARTAAFAGVLIVAALGRSLAWIAACGFGGELLALAVCVLRLRRVHGLPLVTTLKPTAITAFGMAAAVAAFAGLDKPGWVAGFVVGPVVIAMVAAAMLMAYPGLRLDAFALVPGSKIWAIRQRRDVEVQV